MQTLTIQCKNNTVAEHIYSLLSLLPKSEVTVIRDKTEVELEKHKELIQKSFDDLRKGHVTKNGKVAIL